MRAAILTAFDTPLEIAELPAPSPSSPHDVLVRVAGAGVCGSDVHLVEGMFESVLGQPKFPYVLGHENAGYVEAIGEAVSTVKVGDPVLVHPHITCGLCRSCRRGDEAFCEALAFPGIDGQTPGGFAEIFRTSERSIIKLPNGTNPAPLAPLADAGLTAYHAVRRAVPDLPPDGTAVVVGLGGIGYFVLQLLRVFSPAHIIAVDVNEEKIRLGQRLGADAALRSGPDLVDNILKITDGVGADLVMDCVGVEPIPSQALDMLRRGGTYSVLGADKGEACCGTVALTGRELTLRGNLVGTLGELSELVQIVIRNRLALTQTFYPLGKAADAVEDLRKGRVEGRAVIVPADNQAY